MEPAPRRIRGDFHVHSYFSPCADRDMSCPAIFAAAEKAGLTDIGITDHPHRPGLPNHHEEIAQAKRAFTPRVRVWIGAELEVVGKGRLIMHPARLPLADYIVAAPSHYDIHRQPPVPDLDDPVEWADRLLLDMENVPGSGAHVVAHPFFVMDLLVPGSSPTPLARMPDIFAEMKPKRLQWLLESYARDGIALEITPRLAVTPSFEAFLLDFYRQAKSLGIRFVCGSDSHRLDTIGDLRGGLDFLDWLGLGDEDLWHPSMVRKPDHP